MPDDEEDFNFVERVEILKEEIKQQIKDEAKLSEAIQRNFEKIINSESAKQK